MRPTASSPGWQADRGDACPSTGPQGRRRPPPRGDPRGRRAAAVRDRVGGGRVHPGRRRGRRASPRRRSTATSPTRPTSCSRCASASSTLLDEVARGGRRPASRTRSRRWPPAAGPTCASAWSTPSTTGSCSWARGRPHPGAVGRHRDHGVVRQPRARDPAPGRQRPPRARRRHLPHGPARLGQHPRPHLAAHHQARDALARARALRRGAPPAVLPGPDGLRPQRDRSPAPTRGRLGPGASAGTSLTVDVARPAPSGLGPSTPPHRLRRCRGDDGRARAHGIGVLAARGSGGLPARRRPRHRAVHLRAVRGLPRRARPARRHRPVRHRPGARRPRAVHVVGAGHDGRVGSRAPWPSSAPCTPRPPTS